MLYLFVAAALVLAVLKLAGVGALAAVSWGTIAAIGWIPAAIVLGIVLLVLLVIGVCALIANRSPAYRARRHLNQLADRLERRRGF